MYNEICGEDRNEEIIFFTIQKKIKDKRNEINLLCLYVRVCVCTLYIKMTIKIFIRKSFR